MNEIKMNEFGITLTGRPYGKDCFEKISRTKDLKESVLNFKGVIALGSSFGEEVVVPIARNHENKMTIIGANPAVKSCLGQIAVDFKLDLVFED